MVENLPINSDAEFIWVKLLTQESQPVFICSFYRPPICEMEPLLSLNESLMVIAEKEANYPVIILGGDLIYLIFHGTMDVVRLIPAQLMAYKIIIPY